MRGELVSKMRGLQMKKRRALYLYKLDMMMMMMMMMRRMMEAKNCANISQNLLYCSSRYTSTYIGTPKFVTKALWVYSHLKSDFFSEKNLLNVI